MTKRRGIETCINVREKAKIEGNLIDIERYVAYDVITYWFSRIDFLFLLLTSQFLINENSHYS